MKVRGEEFKSPVTFHHTRESLLDKILKILSDSEDDTYGRQYIWKAVEFNALTLAKKALNFALEARIKSRDYCEANSLFDYEWKIWRSFRVRLLEEKNMELADKIREAAKLENEIRRIGNLLAGLFQESHSIWKEVGESSLNKLSSLLPVFPDQAFSLKKWQTWAYFWKGDHQEALVNQISLIESSWAFEIPNRIWIQEMATVAQLYARLNRPDEASRWVYKIRGTEVLSDQEKILKRKLLIRNGIVIGERFYQSNLCDIALRELNGDAHTLSLNVIALFYYTGAWVAFINGKYEKALKFISESRKIPKKDRPNMIWQPLLLKVMVSYSLGEDISASYRSAERQIRKSDRNYPKIALACIKEINGTPPSTISMVISKWMEEFDRIMESPIEADCSHYLDVQSWLLALSRNEDLRSILLKKRSKDSRDGGQNLVSI